MAEPSGMQESHGFSRAEYVNMIYQCPSCGNVQSHPGTCDNCGAEVHAK